MQNTVQMNVHRDIF